MTTLIKNVVILDGTGQTPRKADVIIKRNKIAAIGHFRRYQNAEIIDGMGAYLAPGFIDINTSSDLFLTLFSNPSQKDFLLEGVTTIIGGQNGISLAPIFYGSLELNKLFTDVHKININWHTVGELLATLDRKNFGVNFGTFVGHATIRESIAGDSFRDLTQNELNVARMVLKRSLEEGAFGLSINLNFPLTSLTPYKEIKFLVEEIAAQKRTASINFKICNDCKHDSVSLVEQIINLAKETEARINIENFLALSETEADLKKIADLIDENSAKANIYFSLSPLSYFIAPLFSFLPCFATRGSLEEIYNNLKDKTFVKKIKKELLIKFKSEDFKILSAPRHDYLVGKSLKDFAESKGMTAKNAFLHLVDFLNLRGAAVYKSYGRKNFLNLINYSRAIVSSGGVSFAKDPENLLVAKFYSAFPNFLDFFIKKSGLPIEAAVRKITGLPAKILDLKNRGFIKEKYFADLVIFRDSHIEYVFVNGKIAVQNGKYLNVAAGQVLRG